MTIKLGATIYVMEIKVIKQTEIEQNPALKQIQYMNYAQKYLNIPDVRLYELGLVFSKTTRNLIKADWVSR